MMSSRPKCSWARLTAPNAASRLVTSKVSGSRASPCSALRSSSVLVSRAVAATRSPRSSAAFVHSRPKPREVPVMNHVLLAIERSYSRRCGTGCQRRRPAEGRSPGTPTRLPYPSLATSRRFDAHGSRPAFVLARAPDGARPRDRLRPRATAEARRLRAAVVEVLRECPLSDEAVDGFVGVVLKRRVSQVGEDVRLVDQGTLELVGRAGVEHAAGQGRIGDAVDQSLRAQVKFVGDP